MKKILVIDDEIEMLNSLEKILGLKKEYHVETERDAKKALEKVIQNSYDLILTDLRMNGIGGMDILDETLKNNPGAKVVLISGYGTIEASVEAMKKGAFDFIEKPFTSKKLYDCIERALSISKAITPEKPVTKDESVKNFSGIIYKSQMMEEIMLMIPKIAPGSLNVLITGESGTGKELIARAIHTHSRRNNDPFVPVNCAALPEQLIESELFGHEKGSFTGAFKTKQGLLEFAMHGTFFFDEIGDISPAMQVKLLRMLEDKKIRRVGGHSEIQIDVRIIAATNKNLEIGVRDNKFRQDLYYRLNTIQIEIPPLRERTEDILPLAYHFLHELCKKEGRKPYYFSREAEDSLISYSWPGNVRELQNFVYRAFFLSSSEIINIDNLPIRNECPDNKVMSEIVNLNYKEARERMFEEFEISYLTHHLRKNHGNISQTAAECGIDRRSIHRIIKKYNISL
ncbi:MAG: sigma-54 dependent transcriptional regulator [Ignavibacteriales bacterium]|nr:sigma-54 dependent transcriptional regulator [Ignavibacteriales bacterium]MCF8316860.1 sigma-54 dependent transcriptional regulator [Ignavibacteriales bacterium]MCF8438101.1 sigma-54 dependent transcriptional regulator [Ignavibacteriales bacterium]